MTLYHVRWEEGSEELVLLKRISKEEHERNALQEAARFCRSRGGGSLSLLHVLMGEEAGTLVIDINKEDGVFIPRLRISSDVHAGRPLLREGAHLS